MVKQYFKILVVFTIIFLVISCKDNQKKSLTLAAIPSDDMTQTLEYVKNFSNYLSKELNVKVNYIKATDYTAVIEAMRTNKVQIAMLGPFSYIMASERANAEVLVTLGLGVNRPYSYKSRLLTNINSGIDSLDDIKQNSHNLILSFTDPASTSGHLVPRALLNSMGLDAEKDFKDLVFSGSHAASLLTTISEKTDIAFANNLSWNRVEEFQKIDLSSIKVIWESAPIYPDPVCVPKSMDMDLKTKIQNALLQLKEKDTATWNQFIRYDYAGDPLQDSLRYIKVHDSIYDPLREIASSVHKLQIK